jgi:hypothetical protein
LDYCSDAVTITFEGQVENGGSGCSGDPLVIWRDYRATDTCGNYDDVFQIITVVDDMPPEFISGPADLVVDCPTKVPAKDVSSLSAVDGCDGEVTPTFAGDSDNGGTGKQGDPKIITRIYRATDACGNSADYIQTITFEETSSESTDGSDQGTETSETDGGESEDSGEGEESGGSEDSGESEDSGGSGGCDGGNCP